MKNIFVLTPVVIALSLVFFPSFWVHVSMLIDFYTSWGIFESEAYGYYHQFLVSRLPDRPELPLQEIDARDVTKEKIIELTKDFTWPLIIRGFLGETEAVRTWSDPEWWMTNYPEDAVLCSKRGAYLSDQVDNCTITKWYNQLRTDDPYYIVGATSIFDEHAELHDMVNNDRIDQVEPGKRISTQMFMGVPGHGSDIHCAAGVNIFRQVSGSKKWWFIPPSQTSYLKPSLNANGFSAFTHTLVGKEGKTVSPWMTKIERYTSIVNPGDVLINPPWFWHGILNLGQTGDSIIGCPSRYARGNIMRSAFKSNFFFTIFGLGSLAEKYGLGVLFPGAKLDLQAAITANRKVRKDEQQQLFSKDMDQEHPFDVEAAIAD